MAWNVLKIRLRVGEDAERCSEIFSKALKGAGGRNIASIPRAVSAKFGPSWRSIGETVILQVDENGIGEHHGCTVTVTVRSHHRVKLIDWGSRRSRLDAVIRALTELTPVDRLDAL